jgi:hypothetical protein
MNAGIESCHLEFRETVFDPELEKLTNELRDMGRKLAPMGMSREAYIAKNATNSILFLIDVQKWRSLHFGKRGDFLQLDTPESIAGTFFDFFHENTDYEKIQALRRITRLGHNGLAQMERYELKKASTMAQFLDPMEWGLLDWSTMRMPGQPSHAAPRLFFEPVSEASIQHSLEFVRSKRCPEYPQAFDVGLALFAGVLE